MICNFTNSSAGRDKNVFQAIKLATNLDQTVSKENRKESTAQMWNSTSGGRF